MNREPRLWQHNGLYRIQDHRQITDRHGVLYDVWESRRDENGVLFFVSEDQARAYLQERKVESEDNKS